MLRILTYLQRLTGFEVIIALDAKVARSPPGVPCDGGTRISERG